VLRGCNGFASKHKCFEIYFLPTTSYYISIRERKVYWENAKVLKALKNDIFPHLFQFKIALLA